MGFDPEGRVVSYIHNLLYVTIYYEICIHYSIKPIYCMLSAVNSVEGAARTCWKLKQSALSRNYIRVSFRNTGENCAENNARSS